MLLLNNISRYDDISDDKKNDDEKSATYRDILNQLYNRKKLINPSALTTSLVKWEVLMLCTFKPKL